MTERPSSPTQPDAPPPLGERSMSRRSWLAAGSAMALGACAGSTAAPPVVSAPRPAAGTSVASDDEEIARIMRLASVPGLSFATVGGAGAGARGYGVRRAGGQDAVSADTVFEAASLTKPVFAYLVHRLHTEGVLDVARPLREYLPLPNAADARAQDITARHVLSHSTGWRNWRSTREHVLTSDFAPGSRFSYSGEGFYFLQRVVEKLTGRGIARVMRERVLEPLGMRSSSFIWRPELDAALASPHTTRGVPIDSFGARTGRALHRVAIDSGRPLEDWTHEDTERALPTVDSAALPLPNFLVPNAAASLMTTARDYAAFLGHLLGVPGAPAGGRPVLASMMTPQVTINDALGWGLGVGLEQVGGRTMFWHWGDNPGFKNFVVGDPAAGTAIVVFSNGNNGMRVYERIVRARTGIDHPAFLWI